MHSVSGLQISNQIYLVIKIYIPKLLLLSLNLRCIWALISNQFLGKFFALIKALRACFNSVLEIVKLCLEELWKRKVSYKSFLSKITSDVKCLKYQKKNVHVSFQVCYRIQKIIIFVAYTLMIQCVSVSIKRIYINNDTFYVTKLSTISN